eukprot:6836980-Prymnesium_polylepis.2
MAPADAGAAELATAPVWHDDVEACADAEEEARATEDVAGGAGAVEKSGLFGQNRPFSPRGTKTYCTW